MTKKELFDYFTSSPNPDPNGSQKRERVFKRKHPELYAEFLEFRFDDDLADKPFFQRLYHFLQNDHGNIGRCKQCGKRCSFKWFGTDGYSTFCCSECSNRNDESKTKQREKWNILYGGIGFASPEIRSSFRQTMTERHGGYCSSYCPDILAKIMHSNNKNNGGIGFGSKTVMKKFLFSIENKHGRNWKNHSNLETCICDYVKTIYDGIVVRNDRKMLDGKELDIYIPDLNLAFEINGDFWHMNPELYSEGVEYYGRSVESEREKRDLKTKLAETKGIELIHIWQHDWKNKQNEVKETIKNAVINKRKTTLINK